MELSIYLGRLPIMDADNKIIAYELLHRATGENHTLVDDNVKATARVLVNALNYIGLESLTGYKPALIKVDEKALFDDLILCISPEFFILEILEQTHINDKLLTRIENLHQQGYTLALNYKISEDSLLPSVQKLIPFARYIKIDIKTNTKEKVIIALESLRHLEAKKIAVKVEDIEDFQWAQEAGFDMFEGYYFSKPQIYIKEMIDPDSQLLLELIYLLKKEAPIEEILEIFNNCPYLSINALKFIHLHQKNHITKISSIDQALVLMGRSTLIHWVELMIYAQGNDEYDDDNISSPLGKIAKSRALLMEELAEQISTKDESHLANSAYLVGILSLAEAIFQSSFKKLFSQMCLEKNIYKALKDKEGVLGNLLLLCMAVEKNDFDTINPLLTQLRLSQRILNQSMMKAYKKA